MNRLTLVIALALAACGGDSTAPLARHATYTLTAIDGVAIPAEIGTTTTVTGGALALDAGGTYTLHGSYVVEGGGLRPTLDAAGVYETDGDSLTVHASTLGDLRGAYSTHVVTLRIAGRIWTFTRD